MRLLSGRAVASGVIRSAMAIIAAVGLVGLSTLDSGSVSKVPTLAHTQLSGSTSVLLGNSSNDGACSSSIIPEPGNPSEWLFILNGFSGSFKNVAPPAYVTITWQIDGTLTSASQYTTQVPLYVLNGGAAQYWGYQPGAFPISGTAVVNETGFSGKFVISGGPGCAGSGTPVPPQACVGTGTGGYALGTAGYFTLFVDGTGAEDLTASDTTGAAAFAGAVTASNFTVEDTANPAYYPGFYGYNGASLVVAGSSSQASGGTFNVQKGNYFLGPDSSAVTVNPNGLGEELTSDPVNFSQTTTALTQDASTWAGYTANMSVSQSNSTTTIMPTISTEPPPPMYVANISQSVLNGEPNVNVTGTGNTPVIINVTPSLLTGSTTLSDVKSVEFNGSPVGSTNAMNTVLWNFGSATGVALYSNVQWGGAVLAPSATLSGASQIDGNVIVSDFASSAETHGNQYLFTGCVTSLPPPPPTQAVVSIAKSVSSSATGTFGPSTTFTNYTGNTAYFQVTVKNSTTSAA
ncbi:collagen-binding domain-containing protein, partial [Ferrimicrobium sp.]|uniref:collagen-binding domain-containing protein n=1 Tax=Ferrimicrobium sp. TaxID=2926050 RepID=UPI002604C28F